MEDAPAIHFRSLPAIILAMAGAIMLIAFQNHFAGWLLLFVTALTTLFATKEDRVLLLALLSSLVILGVTPISTDLSYGHMLTMGAGMVAAVAVPYWIVGRFGKKQVIKFKLSHGRRWHPKELLYLLFPAALGYFVLPYFFKTTGDFHNWHVEMSVQGLSSLLVGLVAVGIWDELMFVATMGLLFRHQLTFWLANLTQSVFFAVFLYELGFRHWASVFALVFGMLQGYVFKRTNSLLYAITIHVVFDVVMFFALIHAYNPALFDVFITG